MCKFSFVPSTGYIGENLNSLEIEIKKQQKLAIFETDIICTKMNSYLRIAQFMLLFY